MKSKKLGLVGLVAAASIATTGITTVIEYDETGAWPAPIVLGDGCKGWTVQETAPDHDWSNTDHWTIDGVDGQFTRAEIVPVPDTSSDTTRTFVVHWYKANGVQLDQRPGTGTRVLEDCTPPAEPTASYSGSVDCDGLVSGGGSVNRDGLEGNLVVTVNGTPATVVGDDFTFAGASQPLNVVVMIGEENVFVEGVLVGPPPGGCEPDPEPEPEPLQPTL